MAARLASAVMLATAGGLAACAQAGPRAGAPFAPQYGGIETRLLDDDLVNVMVEMRGARGNEDVAAFARCAASHYTLSRGYGFARHLRTNVTVSGGNWRGDAVYTISPALPRGVRTIDAKVTVADCRDQGIPTV